MRSRPVWIVLASSFLALSGASAQRTTTVGPVLGLNIATFGGDDAVNVDSRTGFLVGGFAAFGLSERFALEPSLLYTQKGGQVEFEEGAEGTIKLTYFQVPVLARFRFPSGNVTPNLMAGPAIAFRSGCTASASQGAIEINVDCDEADVQLSSTDFSVIFGVGLEFGRFMVSARYDYGLTAIPSEGSDDVFNRTISLVGQYGFRLK